VLAEAEASAEIGRTRSVLDVIAPPSERRGALRERLHDDPEATIEVDPNVRTDESFASLYASIADILRAMQAGAAATGRAIEAEALDDVRRRVDRARALFESAEGAETDYRQAVNDLQERTARAARRLRTMLEGDRMALRAALPAAIRAQCVAPSGRMLVMLHPKENVWEMEAMRRFVDELKSIDPEATGVPFTHVESLRDMRQSFIQMSITAVVAIAVLLFFDFRSWKDVLLAMLPLVIGVIWTLELMAYFDIAFNLANFFALPIIIGLSVDAGVHLLHRYHEGGPMRLNPGGTRRAVILTGMTTMIGFGALTLAHHRGLQTLGLVMLLGIGSCLLAAVVILPAVLSFFESRRRT